MVLAGMLCEDTTTGRVRTIDGRPQAFYQLAERDAGEHAARRRRCSPSCCSPPAPSGSCCRSTAPRICTRADDARRLLDERIPRERLGGRHRPHDGHRARWARDRTRAVTDAFGFVHDADRLLVADASLFPTPIGVNPMETIMALATRCAGHVIDNARRLVS